MRQQNPLRGAAGGIFLIGLALAIFLSSRFGGHLFLPILFAGLAFCSLIGSLSTFNPRGIYGGLCSFVWLLGIGILFLPGVGFWPWILVLCGITVILGALFRPIMAAMLGIGVLGAATLANQRQTYQPTYQPPDQPDQPPYQPYQQGYQTPPQPPTVSQQGGQQQPYPQQQEEQPQAQYPQELPPQQQG